MGSPNRAQGHGEGEPKTPNFYHEKLKGDISGYKPDWAKLGEARLQSPRYAVYGVNPQHYSRPRRNRRLRGGKSYLNWLNKQPKFGNAASMNNPNLLRNISAKGSDQTLLSRHLNVPGSDVLVNYGQYSYGPSMNEIIQGLNPRPSNPTPPTNPTPPPYVA